MSLANCPTFPDTYWGNWTDPSECSKSCGIGRRTLRRVCLHKETHELRVDSDCTGQSIKVVNCTERDHCPGI